jgi:enoyl-CoA hydratase/carnithine racemase
MKDYETIAVDVEGGVATLTLNRPEKMNAINFRMDFEFRDAMWALDRDEDVRAIVLTGAGRAFCSGFDMEAGAETFGADTHTQHDQELGVTSDTIAHHYAYWDMVTPVIAAINGSAVGVGLTLPLMFDIRFVAEDAKLGFVFVRRGVLPEANSTWLLPRIIGLELALDLLLSGRMFSGREAVEMGLASRALPRDEVLPAALEYAHDLVQNAAPSSVAITKRLVYRFLQETDRAAAMGEETKLTWWTGEQPDAVEGVMSFFEKRPPVWSGSKHPKLPDDLTI